MSEVVYYKGILKPVDFLTGETLEERCKRIIGDVALEDYESYQEKLMDDFDYYEQYIIHDDILYSVEKNKYDPEDSLFIAKTDYDTGIVDFEVRYYNGGTSFDEAIEYAFDNEK